NRSDCVSVIVPTSPSKIGVLRHRVIELGPSKRQPTPSSPSLKLWLEYDSANAGRTSPRAIGKSKGILNTAAPLSSTRKSVAKGATESCANVENIAVVKQKYNCHCDILPRS